MRGNPAFSVLAAFGLGTVLWLPLVTVAPNRLVSGQGVTLWQVWQTLAAPVNALGISAPEQMLLMAMLLLALLAALFLESQRWAGAAVLVLAGLLMPGLLSLCGLYAGLASDAQSSLVRTSLGGAFWVLMLLLWLAVMDALHRMQAGLAVRATIWLGLCGSLVWLLASGQCDQLSLMKEYANHSESYGGSVVRHLQIVVLTLLPTLCIGLPLGWAINHSAKWQRWLLPLLNIIQIVPSIALFGLLMVPLAWLATVWPALASWGVSGIGLAPAVLALTLYSLLPVVRGTQAGLAQVPAAVQEAACGMGMSAAQIFWSAQLPLAAPVILAGVRTATIQAVGLAAVAALIGAGGLGAIMFDGLFGSAQDLVLLGVLPIVGLALLLDLAFAMLARWVQPATGAMLDTFSETPPGAQTGASA
ncbi:MAG: ABC transporter permease [Rhodoferax sp.]|uniref:ABC transporter permease n=1 Tax=Rhodoferax sp. TaxID=50421 RepID=UPI0026141DB5|nr:ABC transporter permease [Rhodoferax sp.]MDD2880773.1 ABC transporter permease [Rhodoferax sp.]